MSNVVERPLISVIVPTYNRAHLLPRAIRSVITQTYSNFELIIVSEGSTDNTSEVVKSFKDPRIIYLGYKEGPKGPNFARNRGLASAKGDLITFLDDDDELVPDALQTIVDTFTRVKPLGVNVIIFDRLDVEKNRLSGWGLGREERLASYYEFLCKAEGDFLGVYSKNAFKDFRFPENIIGFEGVALLELHKRFLTYYVPKVLYRNYREHGPRLSQPLVESRIKQLPNTLYAWDLFVSKYGEDLLGHCPKKYWEYVGVLGFYLFLNGRKMEGMRKVLASFVRGAMSKYKLLFTLALLPVPSKEIIHLYKFGVRFYNKYKSLLGLTR
ncbi:MAG: glycosyltransferase family 2 protein [Candidatus Bathycorpusculaceae bacterium]